MKLTPKRMFYVMSGVLAVLFLAAIGTVVAGNMLLQSHSKQLKAIKLDNMLIDEQQAAVAKANKDIEKYAELENIANEVVPQDKDQARSVRELTSLAQQNKISLSRIAFPTSSLGTTAPKATTTTTDSTDTPKPTTTPVVTNTVTQTTAVPGISGVYQMAITVQSDDKNPVSYASLISFLQSLETNRRTAQVDTISITPDQKNPSVLSFQLGLNVFIKP